MPEDPEKRPRTRRSLLSRLGKSDDSASWEEFVSIYRKLIYSAALDAGLNHAEAEDVTQDTLLTIWKQLRLRNFKYDPDKGSFRGFVKQTTRFRIKDFLRKKRQQPKAKTPRADKRSSSTATVDKIEAPDESEKEFVSDAEWKQTLLNAAIERVKRQVKPKQFQIFDAYVIKEWPVDKVMEGLGVSRTQVYLAKLRISRLIKNEIKQLETNGL